MVSDKKIFSCFPYISLCKICDPWAEPFWHKVDNLNIQDRGPLGDGNTKYQSSRPCGLIEEDFHLENIFIACVT